MYCDKTCNEFYWYLLRMKVENSACKKHRAHNCGVIHLTERAYGKKVNMTYKLSDISH